MGVPFPVASGGEIPAFAEGLSLLWVLPFAGLLLSIAVLPLVAHHWWERNRNRGLVSAAWGLPVLVFLLVEHSRGGAGALGHAGLEYFSFICLLGSLYVISGGILITGDIRATPRNNTLLLLLGGLIANVIGTTGASMLLIRPLLRINSERHRTLHSVVFFIFVVSNVGGCLTPLGDPPLFLGFLRGVPFWWTLVLWKEWAFMLGALLVLYFAVDTIQYRRETAVDRVHDDTEIEPLRILGGSNFLLLGGVMAAVLLLGEPWREFAMIGLALLSVKLTPGELRTRNSFTWGPIVEVAVLFAGIFVAMVPALQILQVRGAELGVREPWQFFVATGTLSSFLDNAPTYLTFFSVALGLHAVPPEGIATVTLLAPNQGVAFPEPLLIAISLGAVFMGANTYIGNGPNFMVKSIAESTGQKMPSFFGFMLWSVGILGPLFLLVVLLFL